MFPTAAHSHTPGSFPAGTPPHTTHVLTFTGCDTLIVSLLLYFHKLPVTRPQIEWVTLDLFTGSV